MAVPGDQVWVAAGSYTPNPGTANSSFTLSAGIRLYSGFNGTETMLSARNPVTNITTLSGDLSGNDVVGMFTSNRADNSTHVIEVVNIAQPNQRAVVDGFTIRSGHTLLGSANPDLTRRGAGILTAAALTVQNCRFTDNYGESGGGITATTAEASGLLVNNCVFENNEVTAQAAGILMRDLLSGTVKNCTFRNNKTNRGSLYPFLSTNILIDSCLFENNDAGANFCGGFFAWQSNFTLSNSTFKGNKASSATGAYIDGRDGGNLGIIENCLFENNTATNFGAGIYNWQGTVEVRKTTFRGNTANNAAAFYTDGREFDSQLTIEDCLFDKMTSLGGNSSGDLTLATVLIATNDQLVVDPLFISPDFYDYHLSASSPCIDKGIAAGAPTLDLDGNPRKGAGPDQGCYEFQTIGTHHPRAQVLPLRLLPNPAVEHAVIVLENDWAGAVQVRVIAQNGALINSFSANKPAGRWVQNLEIRNLPVGVYSVQVLAGAAFFEGSLVKH